MDSLNLSYLSNPEVIGKNLLEEHSSHHFFIDGKEPIFSLNGEWDFYRSEGWVDELLDYKTLAFKKVIVPNSAEMETPEDLIYTNIDYPWEGKEKLNPGEVNLLRDPVNIYRKKFVFPKEFKGKEYRLRLEGFETAIYVFLNGHFVGYSTRLYVDSEFDLTPYLEKENELVIYNFRFSSSSWILDQDFWKLSGLFRSVSIVAIPEIHLEDIDIKSDLIRPFKDGALSIEGKVSQDCLAQISLCKGDKTYFNEEIPTKNSSFSLHKEIKNILPWSAEHPHLYWLTITLKNGEQEETSSQEIGFSHQEIIHGSAMWNGKPLFIKGVNRHEINDMHGRYLPYADLLFDLELLKKNNVNAIRTSHYPNDKRFYELANRMGFYVMDECCIESHSRVQQANGDKSQYLPGSNPKWEKMALDRASSMYERDKNNVCIFSWSLGNESGGGENIKKLSNYFQSKDKKRWIHYEPEQADPELSAYVSIKSFMYLPPEKLEIYLKEHPDKPVLECEYEHAMGNSLGNFDEYMRLFRKYPNALGGFVWDYIDQGIVVNGKLRYGGDSNDVPNDLNFNCNGILFSDRKEAKRSSKLRTVNAMYSPLQILFENDEAFFSLDPNYTYKDFSLFLEDLVNGKKVKETKIIWKGEEKLIIPYEKMPNEHIRRIRVKNKLNLSEVVFDEKRAFSYQSKEEEKAMQFVDSYHYFSLKDEDFAFIFSKFGLISGLVGIEINGKEILSSQVRPTFYRPISDNDRGNLFALRSSIYMGISKWNAPFQVKQNGQKAIFAYMVGGLGATAEVIYELKEGRYLDVEILYHGVKGMPSLPAFGLDFPLKKEYSSFDYYALGPLDSYPDRLAGENLGFYSSEVSKELLPYSIPQECGNHEGARFVEVPIDETHVLVFEAMHRPFSFKYLPNDEFEIDEAMHMDELPPSRRNHLTIYAAMRGIGGDDSWGAKVHPQYELDGEKEYSLKFRVSLKTK